MGRESGWNPLLKSYPYSEKINSVSLGAEVLFCRLIAQADDYGNYYGDPRMILATLFPHRWAQRTVNETDAGRWRDELVTCPSGPLVATYSVNGVEYLHVIAARRRLRSDVTPEERFPREPATIEADALTGHVTHAARQRPADVPPTYTLDEDPDEDPDEDKTQTKKNLLSPNPIGKEPTDALAVFPQAEDADEVIDYLNAVAKSRFRHSEVSRQNIRARLADGASVDDCRMVIDHKAAQWLGDAEMEQHLNPETLFRPTKFEKNLNGAIRWVEMGKPPIGPHAEDQKRERAREATRRWVEEAENGKRASDWNDLGAIRADAREGD